MGYLKGSQPPDGYIAWHIWAEAQTKAGLVQSQCPRGRLWWFPQEKHDATACQQTTLND